MGSQQSTRDSPYEVRKLVHRIHQDDGNGRCTQNGVDIKYQDETSDGVINFRGITRETKAKFILLSDQTRPKEAWEKMQMKLKMKVPSLIISVIGGARDFHLDDRIETSFKATILKASLFPDSFIITGGNYTGVMKIVGDALQESSGVCLGISPWNNIMNKEIIEYDGGQPVPYVVGSWLCDGGLYLDYQHTDFIVVKEVDKDKGQCMFRSSLERYLMEIYTPPAVLLVVNGGVGTLDFLYEVVTNSVCPVVIVHKTGRVADLVAYGLRNWKEIKENEVAGETHEELFKYMKRVLLDKNEEDDDDGDKSDDVDGKGDDKWVDAYYPKLIACLEKRNLFSVAEVGTENDIDTTVLNALLAGKKEETFEKMKLTLLWGRADYARTNIFSARPMVVEEDLKHVMIMALCTGNHEYVKLLMDYGVNMHELLTVEILEFLYGDQSRKDNFLLSKYVNLTNDGYEFERCHKSDRIGGRTLRGKVVRRILNKKLCTRFMDNEVRIFNAVKDGKDLELKTSKFEDPFWELFMWAVICNMPKMARFFWHFGRNQMAKALIAAEIWCVLGTYDGKYKQETETLNEGSNLFKALAHDLLDECGAHDEEKTNKLCTTPLPEVPNMTCLEIAVATNHYEYVAHNSIQMLLADVWTGYMKTRKVTGKDYLRTMFLIVAFPFLITGKEGDKIKDHKRTVRARPNAVIGYMGKLREFYFHTPIVTFIIHFVGCVPFLVLYAYIVVTANESIQKGPWEMLLTSYVVGQAATEIYQITQYDGGLCGSHMTKIRSWISDHYNKVDLLNIVLFFVAWLMSFNADTFSYARTLHAINCGFWILRIITVLRVHPTLGLYLEMIHNMLKDLIWFLLILGTFVMAYGITSTALLHPGMQKPIVYLHMFLRSWFSIYGEYFLEMMPDNNNITHLKSPKFTAYDEYVVWVILGVYLLITNILLLNIIIAAFNSTYVNVQTRATYISKYRIYDLVVEYSKRASTPSPLSLVHHLFLLIRWLCRRSCNTCTPTDQPTKLRRQKLSASEMEKLSDWEFYCAVKMYNGHSKANGGTEEDASQKVLKRIEAMEDKMSVAMEKLEENAGGVTQPQEHASLKSLTRIEALEEKMSVAMEKLEENAGGVTQPRDGTSQEVLNKIFDAIENMDQRISHLGATRCQTPSER